MATGIVLKGLKGGVVLAKFHGSGFIALNHATASIGANSAGETVQEMHITSAMWSCGNSAYWTVARGANTVLLLNETENFDLTDGSIIDNIGGEGQSNVVVTKVGSGPVTLILKLHKRVAITGGSAY